MSSETFPYNLIREEAWDEIKEEQENLRNAIVVEALNLAIKEGHLYIDKTYIKKALKRVRMWGKSRILVWTLWTTLLVLGILTPIQISGLHTSEALALPSGVQISLWLFPIFSIVLIVILSLALKDFIF